ncbi:NUDIX domain-containing protein [Demequina oxidasica]|uniref:NUDIX domain-containing protein n=1 Tax=Demequina oxidasica TaxID=676199 RepID=UPI0007812FD5|nr:NUDIX hydrolase [Demequina oxidasica]
MESDGFRLADRRSPRPVIATSTVFEGRVWNVDSDDIDLGEAGRVTRDYVAHPGAVAIFALNERGEVYLVHQYRHPVRSELWEPPAGLLDVEGEALQAAAARELYEEADLRAATWHTLIDFYTSPGGSSEAIRVFLARDISEVPLAERHVREDEEADMGGRWVPLDEVLKAITLGDVACPPLLVGAFALDAARRDGWATLRPADAPWIRE